MPFRVTGADPSLGYLREGMVDLLAAEFNGDGAPRAVEPGEALRAWSRAGGARAYLGQAATLRLAHELGAGQLLVGAVVGNPRRITVTVSIVNVPRGSVRVPTIVVEAAPDSLTSLVAGLSAQLLGRAFGAWRLSETEPGTTSNEAIRAYISGQEAWRSGKEVVAADLFARALSLDSGFALASYWHVMLRRLQNGFPNTPDDRRRFRLAWKLRDRLGPAQRSLLEAAIGPSGPEGGDSRGAITVALERAVPTHPRSPEAWNLLGDRFFHDGELLGRDDWRTIAKHAFNRGLMLDTAAALLEHGAYLALYDRDMAGHSLWLRLLTKREGTRRATLWHQYAAAVVSQNPARVGALRRRFASEAVASSAGQNMGYPWLGIVLLPLGELDSLVAQLQALAQTPAQRRQAKAAAASVSSNGGRPKRAAAARLEAYPDSLERYLSMLNYADDDSVAAERLSRALLSAPDSARYRVMHCEVALTRLRHRDTNHVAATIATLRGAPGPYGRLCAEVTAAIMASLQPGDSLRSLRRIDSVLKSVPEMNPLWNHDVALAFARRGEWNAAAAAARRRLLARPWRLAISLRDEGRWALLAADTANAIRAFRDFLVLRENPEPELVPERDSIRAELGRLTVARRSEPGAQKP